MLSSSFENGEMVSHVVNDNSGYKHKLSVLVVGVGSVLILSALNYYKNVSYLSFLVK
jgi:hypothetical protein